MRPPVPPPTVPPVPQTPAPDPRWRYEPSLVGTRSQYSEGTQDSPACCHLDTARPGCRLPMGRWARARGRPPNVDRRTRRIGFQRTGCLTSTHCNGRCSQAFPSNQCSFLCPRSQQCSKYTCASAHVPKSALLEKFSSHPHGVGSFYLTTGRYTRPGRIYPRPCHPHCNQHTQDQSPSHFIAATKTSRASDCLVLQILISRIARFSSSMSRLSIASGRYSIDASQSPVPASTALCTSAISGGTSISSSSPCVTWIAAFCATRYPR